MYKDNKGINCGLLQRYNRNILMLLSEYSKSFVGCITDETLSRVVEQKSSQSNNIPNLVKRLEQCFPLYRNLLAEVAKQQNGPSRLHTQAWPILVKISNLIGNAQTRKGKSSAFLFLALTHTEYQCTSQSERCVHADDLSSHMTLGNYLCHATHDSRDQIGLERATAGITSDTANDVAFRRLDVDDMIHVINYEFPRKIEVYVHRIDRTGRAGRSGKSISFVADSNRSLAVKLIIILEKAEQIGPESLPINGQ
uniref:Helicase C-terminal domain-containing protein n=1 Tax=Glossina austeni TaxID=7395 RepID=A0A1A9UYU8_GLOAU